MADETTKKGGGRGRDLADELMGSAHRVWLAGLGALSRAEEEGSKIFQQLVDRGREVEGRGPAKVREAVRGGAENVRAAAGGFADAVDARVDQVLERMGVPTRDEIHELTRRIEQLNARIEGMGRGGTAAGKPPKS